MTEKDIPIRVNNDKKKNEDKRENSITLLYYEKH